MARFPVIESPCPIAGKRVPSGASEHCSSCDRTVFNLNSLNDAERVAFMRGCSGKVCVAYTVRVPLPRVPQRHGALAAATLAAAAFMALPAAADVAADQARPVAEVVAPAQPPANGAADVPKSDDYGDLELIGGVLDAGKAEWRDDGSESAPEMPVVEDDGK
jgi:hypothetical protein